MSTMHHDKSIDESTGEKQKPEMITFYNSTKAAYPTCSLILHNKERNTYDPKIAEYLATVNQLYRESRNPKKGVA